jgi:hydroxymethylglutaryl-CoA lyase
MGVRLFEVSPRDGLQNEPEILSADVKVAYVERLISAGFTDIEVGSFVRPRFIPQLADSAEVIRRLPQADGVRYWALVPNPIGLDRALDAGAENIAIFLSASETHNKKNVNRTVQESLAGLKKVLASATAHNLGVRAYISTVFGCPFEGDVAVERTTWLAQELRDAGADIIVLGDTTGMADPVQVTEVVNAVVAAGTSLNQLAVHFHDTRGTALANSYAAWQVGVRMFDGAVAGIGGCPYAPGASGNVATEDLVYLFDRLGEDSGVDLDAACAAGMFMEQVLGRPLPGRFQRFWQAQKARRQARSA